MLNGRVTVLDIVNVIYNMTDGDVLPLIAKWKISGFRSFSFVYNLVLIDSIADNVNLNAGVIEIRLTISRDLYHTTYDLLSFLDKIKVSEGSVIFNLSGRCGCLNRISDFDMLSVLDNRLLITI